METILSYRGRGVTAEDVAFIRSLIADNPGESRRKLSRMLCEAWQWVQPNGEYRDQVCRSLMLELHRAGLIELPAKRCSPPNPLAIRRRPALPSIDEKPLEGSFQDISKPHLHQVRRDSREELFNGLIEHYHYLGYTQPVGEHLKYLVEVDEQPVACFSWSSAPRHIGVRDRFIGWSTDKRKRNIHLIAYNSRFLILPWIRVSHLASHLLSRMARGISRDWEEAYGHPIHFLETFVDTERFQGICYKAANWTHLGKTTGRGKNDQTKRQNRSIKDVWGYFLCRDFRERLCR